MSLTFENFCENWIQTYRLTEKEQPNKYERAKERGRAFKELFLELLTSYVPKDYKIFAQMKIEDVDHKFNFVIGKPSSSESVYEKSDILAVIEAKSHGFFGYAPIHQMKSVFEDVKQKYPSAKIFYVTFRETNTYDLKFKDIFGRFSQDYYRLSDSGDGVQVRPRYFFPSEWDRLTRNLSSLGI